MTREVSGDLGTTNKFGGMSVFSFTTISRSTIVALPAAAMHR
jgi:hypothetical protein